MFLESTTCLTHHIDNPQMEKCLIKSTCTHPNIPVHQQINTLYVWMLIIVINYFILISYPVLAMKQYTYSDLTCYILINQKLEISYAPV